MKVFWLVVVIIVIPQTLKTGDKTSELGSVLWINVPTALHHLHKPWLKIWIGKTLTTAANGSFWTLNSGMLSGSLHLRISASHGLFAVSSMYALQILSSSLGFRFSLTRIRFSSFLCSFCCLSCNGNRGYPLSSEPQTWECQRTKHRSCVKICWSVFVQ